MNMTHYSFDVQVFESLKLTAYDLNVDMLDVHAVSMMSDFVCFHFYSEIQGPVA